jgi:hypothetical protein
MATKYAKGSTVRPETLASDLGISGKIVRSFLRANYTRPIEAKGTTWVLDAEQANATFDHFMAKRPKPNA